MSCIFCLYVRFQFTHIFFYLLKVYAAKKCLVVLTEAKCDKLE